MLSVRAPWIEEAPAVLEVILARDVATLAELSVAGTNASAGGLYASAGMTPDFTTERWELRAP